MWDELGGDYCGVSWWVRDFEIPADWVHHHLRLCFEAVRMRAEVFLNEKLVGYDLVGQTPFEVDVTNRVRPGINRLAVRVTDPGGNFSWEDFDTFAWGGYRVPASHGFGGVTGGVRLLALPAVHVADVFVRNTANVTTVTLAITLRNTSAEAALVRPIVRITPVGGGDPVTVAELTAIAVPPGEHGTFHSLSVPDARPWSPADPALYHCDVTLHSGSTTATPPVDTHRTRFGFRWFTPEGIGKHATLRLNGRRIVLRSAISWSFWPRTGSVPTPQHIERHLCAARTLGLNMLNFHRAIGDPRILDRADELGLLYYAEPGGYWCRGGDAFSFRWAREQLLRMIRRDRNHPALVIYNLINEQEWAPHERHDFDLTLAQAADPTRIITYTSGWNTPGDDPKKLHVRPGDPRPYIYGWTDEHHAAGPGVQCDEFYRAPDDYRLRTMNVGEIVFWGEDGAIATPPQLERIRAELEHGTNGWDGAAYRAWHAGWAAAFAEQRWDEAFPTLDDLARACGNVAYHYQGRTIENVRLGNLTDGYVVNGWESQPRENHSGIVDEFRHFKGDPAILAHYNQPLYLAVKLRQRVGHAPLSAIADVHLVNEIDLRGPARLRVVITDSHGRTTSVLTREVTVRGGDTFGEPLALGIALPPATVPGTHRVEAWLAQDGQDRATGFDELFVVDWRSQPISRRGAVLGTGRTITTFLQRARQVELPLLAQAASAPDGLDYLVIEGCDPLPRAVVPTLCLHPRSGARTGLTGEYFRGRNFDTPIFRRVDPTIDFLWPQGPDPAIGSVDFSICWQGRLRAPTTGNYILHLSHDDGARLWLDGELLIDEWTPYETWSVPRKLTSSTRALELVTGRDYELQIDFYQQPLPWRALIKLEWTTPDLVAGAAPAVREVLRRVHDEGVTALIFSHAPEWAHVLASAGALVYEDWLQGGLYWLGSNFVVRDHPVLAGLPVNTAMNWEYQEFARYESQRTGLVVHPKGHTENMTTLVGMVTGHQPTIAGALTVVRHGTGCFVLSTLDFARCLLEDRGPAEVPRKLLCNLLTWATRQM